MREQEARADELNQLMGGAELSEWMTAKRATVEAIESGFLRRQLFVVDAVTTDSTGKRSD